MNRLRMNSSSSLAGKILRVDLGSKKIFTEHTDKYARKFIGGRAINSFILLNEMNPETKWSYPENMLIFGVGCLAGTLAPGACRVSVDTKNAFNNGKGSANFGGHFGPELKYAGFDHVVITGKAEKPVYLWIYDGNAELRDAGAIWGKTTYETEAVLRRELGDDRVEVASIGPAGENRVRGSSIISDCAKAAGGSGVGCIMGDKKLKAIAVRGHGAIKVADPERFMNSVNTALAKVEASPFSKGWRKGSVEGRFLPESPVWNLYACPRNAQDEYWPPEKRTKLVGMESGVPGYKKRMMACFACPIGCMPFSEIEEGKYKGTKGLGYWINSVWYSVRFDVDDPAASLKFHLLANQLGLDGDMAATVISWAFECYEKGLLTRKDTDGLELEWGNADAMIRMVEKLAYREGIGDLLADGVKEASRKVSKGSEAFAIHMKGQDSVDPYRAAKGFGFAVATSPVAGRHLRGAVSNPEVTGPKDLSWSPDDYKNIPEAVFWQAQTKEIEDLAGLCVYVGTWSGAHALEVSDYAELISSAMGIDVVEEELMMIGRRSINLEKAFNALHTGFDRKDDYPPGRFWKEPITSGPFAGVKCDREKWDEMLDRFYELQGWDKRTGLQTKKVLTELGMEDVAQRLEKAGKLI
ncbi:MAG: aldehyde ferredoxin oxidoreductase family protein [Deltaproteobacteria bacterium]|nr:aldehyde ferredoxin oxidoreductase family protein [Deltaproteobacteria bacterium]